MKRKTVPVKNVTIIATEQQREYVTARVNVSVITHFQVLTAHALIKTATEMVNQIARVTVSVILSTGAMIAHV